MSSTTVLGDLRPFEPVPEISIALPTTQRIIIVYLVQNKNNHRHAKTADLYPFHKNNQNGIVNPTFLSRSISPTTSPSICNKNIE